MKLRYKIVLCVCGSLLILRQPSSWSGSTWSWTASARWRRSTSTRTWSGPCHPSVRHRQRATGTSDWAIWDDTYYFAEDGNQDYIDSNFQVSSFTSCG